MKEVGGRCEETLFLTKLASHYSANDGPSEKLFLRELRPRTCIFYFLFGAEAQIKPLQAWTTFQKSMRLLLAGFAVLDVYAPIQSNLFAFHCKFTLLGPNFGHFSPLAEIGKHSES